MNRGQQGAGARPAHGGVRRQGNDDGRGWR